MFAQLALFEPLLLNQDPTIRQQVLDIRWRWWQQSVGPAINKLIGAEYYDGGVNKINKTTTYEGYRDIIANWRWIVFTEARFRVLEGQRSHPLYISLHTRAICTLIQHSM